MSQTILFKRTATIGNTPAQAPSFLTGEIMMNTTDLLMWGMGSTVAFKILTENNSITDLFDIDSTMIPNTGDVLRYDASGKWVANNLLSKLEAIHLDTTEPTGVLNRDDSIISFSDITRTFTISPTVTDYAVYVKGEKTIINTSKDFVISNITGLHYIYMDVTGTLHELTTFDINTIFKDNVYLAVVYWNATSSESIYVGDERHGTVMDWATHSHFHLSFGAQYIGGLGLGNMVTDGNGDLDTNAQLSVSSGSFKDEDLFHHIIHNDPQVLEPIAQIPIAYREGITGDFRINSATNFPVINTGTGRLAYNEWTGSTWQLSEAGNNSFVLMHIYATNDIVHPIFGVIGITEYGTKAQAQAGANDEIDNLGELPYEELVAIGTIIYQTADSYTNAVKARIISTDQGDDYVDWRTIQIGAATSLGDHNILSGRGDANAHPIAAITDLQAALDSKSPNAGSSTQDFAVQNLTVTGSIVPTTPDLYDLGSATHPFRDLYLGPQSLYVNGQQVISNTADTMNFHADPDQNIRVQTDGVGDIELAPIGLGNISLKGTVEIIATKQIKTSDGSDLPFGQGASFNGNVDADALLENGIPIADKYALVSGSSVQNFSVSTLTATGAITAASFSGDGSLVTNVDALTLNGISGSELMPLYRSFSNLSSLDVVGETYIFSREDTLFPGGTLPAGASNATGVISLHTQAGNYTTQVALSTNTNDLFIRSDNNTGVFGTWEKIYSEGNFGKTEIDALNIDAGTVDGIEGANIVTVIDTQNITGAKTFTSTLTGTIANFSGDVSIGGNLNVTGSTTTVNTTELQVQDKNIELGVVTTPTDASAEGGGITLLGTTNKTITWLSSKAAWDFNQGVSITTTTPSVTLYDTSLTDANASINVSSGNLNIWSPNLAGAGDIIFGAYGNLNLTGDLLVQKDSTLYKVYHEGNLDPANLDAITLDGLDSTQFLRSDVDDQKTGKLFMDDHFVTTYPLIGRDYGNEMWMIDKIGTFTPSANIINNTACFRKGDSYAYFNDGAPAVFEVTGLSLSATTAVTSRRIVIFPHQGFTTDLQIEVQKADNLWSTVYNQNTTFTGSKWEFYELTGITYPTDWNIKGVRWTFSNYGTVNRYIGQLGITNIRDYQTFEYLGRQGGNFYESIYGRTGTTANVTIDPAGFITATNLAGSGTNITNVNAELLDSLDSTQFLRSDVTDSKSGNLVMTNGDIQFATGLTGFTNPNGNDLLRTSTSDGGNASVIGNILGTTYIDSLTNPVTRVGGAAAEVLYHTGNLTKSVIDGLGVDAETLDNLDSTQFLRADISDTMNGSLTVTGTITEGATPLSNKYLGIGATAANTTLFDNLDVSRFVRSDISDTMTGDLTIARNDNVKLILQHLAGQAFRFSVGTVGGAMKFSNTGSFGIQPVADIYTDVALATAFSMDGTGDISMANDVSIGGILSGNGSGLTNVNATTLDSLDSTQFIRSDINDNVSGELTVGGRAIINNFNGGLRLSQFDVNGNHFIHGTNGPGDNIITLKRFGISDYDIIISKGGTGYTAYHAGNLTTSVINALNVNATTLDSLDSTQFLRSDIDDTMNANLTVTGNITSDRLYFGTHTAYLYAAGGTSTLGVEGWFSVSGTTITAALRTAAIEDATASGGGDIKIGGLTRGSDLTLGKPRLLGNTANADAVTNITGGDVEIAAGNGSANSLVQADGGDVTIDAGIGYGTGTNGNILIGTVNDGKVGIGTNTPGSKLDVWTTTGIVPGSIEFNFRSVTNDGNAGGMQYGMMLEHGAARYSPQTALYATIDSSRGQYGNDYKVIHAKFDAIGTNAGKGSDGVLSELTIPTYNYQRLHAGVRSSITHGETSIAGLYGFNSVTGNFGGHFTSHGKAHAIGVYADAYLDAGAHVDAQAIPIIAAANGVELMRVNGDGNVGIGVSAPTAKLDMSGGIARFKNGSSNYLEIDGSDGANNHAIISNRFNQLQFKTNTGAGAPHIALLPATGGNVGIGNAAPTERLEVTGNIKFTNDGSQLRNSAGNTIFNDTANTINIGNGLTSNVIMQYGNVGIGTDAPTAKLDIREIWNDGLSTFTGINLDITNTASDIASNLLDFKVDTNSRMTLSPKGILTLDDSDVLNQRAAGLKIISSDRNVLLKADADGGHSTGLTGPTFFRSYKDGPNLVLGSGNGNGTISYFRFESEGVADTVALRRTVNPQAFNIYNTYTDASNYERGYVKWDTNELRIGTTYLGTGIRRTLRIGNPGTDGGNTIIGCGNFAGSTIQFNPSGTASFDMKYREFSPYEDNISVLGTNLKRFKELHLATDLSIGDSKQGTQSATLATVTQTAIATFDATLYLSGKFIVQVKDTITGEVHVTEILVVHDGTNVNKTEYGTLHTGTDPLATFDVDINLGFVRILATAASANSTDYKVSETLVKA